MKEYMNGVYKFALNLIMLWLKIDPRYQIMVHVCTYV